MKRMKVSVKLLIIFAIMLGVAAAIAVPVMELTLLSYLSSAILSLIGSFLFSIFATGIYTMTRGIVHWLKEIR